MPSEPPLAEHGAARWLARLASTLAGLAALLAAGCAAIPSGGPVQSARVPPALAGTGGGCCGLTVGGPRPGWSPEDVVSGFLLASASFANNYAIAREYLTRYASAHWRPSAVVIVSQTPSVAPVRHQVGPQGTRTVLVTAQVLATLSNGQYIPAGQGKPTPSQPLSFTLQQFGGRYLITSLPTTEQDGKVSRELLLSSYLFHLEYTPYDLYYYAPGNRILVPDPVFLQNGARDPASTLVRDVLHSPSGWLGNAVTTAAPRGARLRKVQALPGKTAIVDLGVPPAAPGSQVRQLAAQLVTTLTSPAYSPALFQAVKIQINGHPWAPAAGAPVLDTATYAGSLPSWRSDAAVYYLAAPSPAGPGGVRKLGRLAPTGVPVPGQAGSGQIPLSEIAVSPAGRYLAGVAGPAGPVYTAPLGTGGQGQRQGGGQWRARLTGSFTGLSWDPADELWVAGRVRHTTGMWVLPGAGGPPVRVRLPAALQPVTGLRVAPDGVRIALIVGSGGTARLVLAAIVRAGGQISIERSVPLAPGLAGPFALTWYDDDHLLVAAAAPGRATKLWEVPANGNTAASRPSPAGIVSITAAGTQNPLYISLANGRLEKSVGVGSLWTDFTAGQAATYPG